MLSLLLYELLEDKESLLDLHIVRFLTLTELSYKGVELVPPGEKKQIRTVPADESDELESIPLLC